MKLKKYITSIVMMTLSLALTVGCSSSENNDIQTSEVKQGEEVVVADSVAVTEILDKLGVKVSGVPTTSYELPESVKNATEVGSPNESRYGNNKITKSHSCSISRYFR